MHEQPLAAMDATAWDRLRRSRPVILFGSFLSTYAPASLPSGEVVSGEIFRLLFGDGDWTAFPWLQKDFERVPFEALMEAYPAGSDLPEVLVELYGKRATNPVYEALIEGVRHGLLSALVTTNYDCAVEAALRSDDAVKPIVSAEDWAHWKEDASTIPYVKVHGTADSRQRESLVFDLRREGVLDPWKREAVHAVLEDRPLIVLGFSGRDFDVCPELAAARVRSLPWLQPDPAHASANARRVLQAHGGSLIVGDLLGFLEGFLGRSVHARRSSGTADSLSARLRTELFDLWRVRILDRMACRRLAEPLLDSLTGIDDATLDRLRISMAGHAGRDREIARTSEDRAAAAAERPAERARWLLSASFGWLTVGKLSLAGRRIEDARNLLDRIDDPAQRSSVESEVLQARFTFVMRRAQIAEVLGRTRIVEQLRDEGSILESQLREALTVSGALGARQAVRHNAQRLGIEQKAAWPLPAEAGYRTLGMHCMEAIRMRDWIRARPWWLSRERADVARFFISVADAYGWHHEAWKLRWILLWRCPLGLRSWNPLRVLEHIWDTGKHFVRVEYSLVWRVVQAGYSILPTSDAASFDPDSVRGAEAEPRHDPVRRTI